MYIDTVVNWCNVLNIYIFFDSSNLSSKVDNNHHAPSTDKQNHVAWLPIVGCSQQYVGATCPTRKQKKTTDRPSPLDLSHVRLYPWAPLDFPGLFRRLKSLFFRFTETCSFQRTVLRCGIDFVLGFHEAFWKMPGNRYPSDARERIWGFVIPTKKCYGNFDIYTTISSFGVDLLTY